MQLCAFVAFMPLINHLVKWNLVCKFGIVEIVFL